MSTKKTIAIVGASRMRNKFGNKCVRAYQAAGWDVFPINLNPNEGEIEGVQPLTSVTKVPVDLGRISVYLPPPLTLELLPEIAQKGAEELWLNPGTHDDAVLTKAKELGLNAIPACSIVDIGYSPSQFPDA